MTSSSSLVQGHWVVRTVSKFSESFPSWGALISCNQPALLIRVVKHGSTIVTTKGSESAVLTVLSAPMIHLALKMTVNWPRLARLLGWNTAEREGEVRAKLAGTVALVGFIGVTLTIWYVVTGQLY